MARDTLGVLEFEVVRVLMTKTKDAYGVSIADALQELSGRRYSVGAIYTVLERLEKKEFVSSQWGEPTEERGGRRKRLYKLEAAGRAAYARSEGRYQQLAFSAAQPVGA